MAQMSSGTYVIDSEYNIVNFNETAAALYPVLRKGEKCYKVLMNRDCPCDVCPVFNGIKGPRTYLDPIRHLYETVDAVEVPLEDGTTGHALVFSTVGEREQLAKQLPTDEKGLRLLGVINALSKDISGLYEVNRESRAVTVYRAEGKLIGAIEENQKVLIYEEAMEDYISHSVHPDDQGGMRKITEFDSLCETLSNEDSVIYHYRVLMDGEVHYFYMKCVKNGVGQSFSSVIFAFANEDLSVNRSKIKEILTHGNTQRRRKILIADDNEMNREILKELFQDDYDIEEAADGNEAYAILKSKYRELAVVFLDLVMPNCDGFRFLEKIKGHPMLSAVPVIVLTGSFDKMQEERCLELGAVDFLTKPYNPAVIKARLRNVIRMKEMAVFLDAIEIDELTGLYTKQAFIHHAQVLLDANPNDSYDVVISEIENCKLVNSIYGEEKGDELIKHVADLTSKYSQNGISGRYGGDQIISIHKSPSKEMTIASKNMFQEFIKSSPIPNVVMKFGVYEHVDRSITVSHMCDRALLALKSIKHNYSRTIAKYNGPVSQHRLRAQTYEARFQSALQNKEFIVWYQPKYNPYTEKVIGAEALVRWEAPDGMISPGEFMEVFESDGLIGKLDEYVFRSVCNHQKKWKELGYELIPISVNLSRYSLYASDIVARYKSIVDECGIDPKVVPIEITESAAIASLRIKPIADAFYEAGFRLHMDDFGSGRSSLNGLNVLHFDVVKLDKCLIDFIGDKNGELILIYTMALGKELGLQLVAEGVENETQLTFLKENGCDAIQGYYFSKPLPVDEFEQIVRNNLEPERQFYCRKKRYSSLTSADQFSKHIMVRTFQRMPGGFFTYEAHGDERILSSNCYLWELFGCKSEQEFLDHVHGSFKGFVCPEELERVERSIAHQIEGSTNEMDYVEYHIVRKDGTKIPVVDYGHLSRQGDSDVFYVFISEAER